MKWLFMLFLFLFQFDITISAQATRNNDSLPDWVLAIDNPQVNYYQALRDFDNYWNGKVKPELDDREREEDKQHRLLEKQLQKMSPAQHNQYDVIAYHYKRFLDWQHEVKPFVQEDGRILTPAERVEIWQKQQNSKPSTR